jgi:hypothetical protein
MTELRFQGRQLTIGPRTVDLPMDILDAFVLDDRVIVLGDPDSELRDPRYPERRAAGLPSRRNLVAFALDGSPLWEAEFPEDIDCYFRIISREPLVAVSFSGFTCHIDPASGRIRQWEFHK